jgi:hypothetical protein
MKTDDLIAIMARDVKAAPRGVVPRRLLLVALAGAVVALAILVPWLGLRDMGSAVASETYWMKTAYTLALALGGFLLAERLARPGVGWTRGLVVAGVGVAVMAALAVMQLVSTPAEEISAALLGSTWDRCPWRIVALAVPGLIATLLVMRRFAPTRPALAGAGAGLFVGGVAATVYGLHCGETSAVFTLIWYTGGIVGSTVLGALAGSRMLRW